VRPECRANWAEGRSPQGAARVKAEGFGLSGVPAAASGWSRQRRTRSQSPSVYPPCVAVSIRLTKQCGLAPAGAFCLVYLERCYRHSSLNLFPVGNGIFYPFPFASMVADMLETFIWVEGNGAGISLALHLRGWILDIGFINSLTASPTGDNIQVAFGVVVFMKMS